MPCCPFLLNQHAPRQLICSESFTVSRTALLLFPKTMAASCDAAGAPPSRDMASTACSTLLFAKTSRPLGYQGNNNLFLFGSAFPIRKFTILTGLFLVSGVLKPTEPSSSHDTSSITDRNSRPKRLSALPTIEKQVKVRTSQTNMFDLFLELRTRQHT